MYEIRINNDLEGWDLLDTSSDQSHDGDGAKELICTVYDETYALIIRNLLNEHTLECADKDL